MKRNQSNGMKLKINFNARKTSIGGVVETFLE
jgi:hypothetical protein